MLSPSAKHELTRRLIAGHFARRWTADVHGERTLLKCPSSILRVFLRLPNSNVSTSSNATEGNNVPLLLKCLLFVFNAGK